MPSSPKSMKFLLISDIHFGSSDSKEFCPIANPPQHSLSHSIPMKQNLIKTLAGYKLDALLVAGDLTGKAAPAEFAECWNAIVEIADALNISRNSIFVAFGNHDINWQISRMADLPDSQADPLYGQVAAILGPHFMKAYDATAAGPIPGAAIFKRDKFRLFVANSGFYSLHDQKYYHGKLGTEQLDWLKTELLKTKGESLWRIMLLHHHPFKYTSPAQVEDISCLEEGSELLDALAGSGFDLVCHGHRHHPKIFTEMSTGWLSPITFLCAGSLSVQCYQRVNGHIPNIFHVVSLESRDNKNAANGFVETYQYSVSDGWKKNQYSDMAPFDHVHYFGSIAAQTEKSAILKQIVDTVIASESSSDSRMPPYASLPHDLHCLPYHELNDSLKVVVAQFGFRALGLYPGDVVIQKVR